MICLFQKLIDIIGSGISIEKIDKLFFALVSYQTFKKVPTTT